MTLSEALNHENQIHALLSVVVAEVEELLEIHQNIVDSYSMLETSGAKLECARAYIDDLPEIKEDVTDILETKWDMSDPIIGSVLAQAKEIYRVTLEIEELLKNNP